MGRRELRTGEIPKDPKRKPIEIVLYKRANTTTTTRLSPLPFSGIDSMFLGHFVFGIFKDSSGSKRNGSDTAVRLQSENDN